MSMKIPVNDQPFAKAMFALASKDPQTARRLMREATREDHRLAFLMYATFLEYGVGGKSHIGKAMTHYRRAADFGDRTACLRLARWHRDQKQLPQARFWLNKAVGDVQAELAKIEMDRTCRSVRTTNATHKTLTLLRILTRVGRYRKQLTSDEQATLASLEIEYRNRRPEVTHLRAKKGGISNVPKTLN